MSLHRGIPFRFNSDCTHEAYDSEEYDGSRPWVFVDVTRMIWHYSTMVWGLVCIRDFRVDPPRHWMSLCTSTWKISTNVHQRSLTPSIVNSVVHILDLYREDERTD